MPLSPSIDETRTPQPDAVELATDFAESEGRIVSHRVGARIVTRIRPAVMLDENDFIAKPLQAGQEMQLREQMATQRVTREIAGNDGDGLGHAPTCSSILASTLRASNHC